MIKRIALIVGMIGILLALGTPVSADPNYTPSDWEESNSNATIVDHTTVNLVGPSRVWNLTVSWSIPASTVITFDYRILGNAICGEGSPNLRVTFPQGLLSLHER